MKVNHPCKVLVYLLCVTNVNIQMKTFSLAFWTINFSSSFLHTDEGPIARNETFSILYFSTVPLHTGTVLYYNLHLRIVCQLLFTTACVSFFRNRELTRKKDCLTSRQ